MAFRANPTNPTPKELSELSALADGTLEPSRRPEVEARIAASPELSAMYERERRVVEALHHARATDRAPDRLRARIEAARPSRTVLVRRRLVYAGGLAGALAAIAVALVLALPGGTPGSPSVSEAAALAARGSTESPPAPDPADPDTNLYRTVGEVQFPNWNRLRWHAVGARTDTLDGHKAATVYYQWHDKRIAYTIVSAPALAKPAAHPTWVHGTELRTMTQGGRLVVSWYRSGDTCVLSGTGVTAAELQKLAAWKVPAES
jgi:anti-sigma factor RsiW